MKTRNNSKKKIVYLMFFVVFLFGLSIANATEYYVATDGSDSNPGTIAQPWLTLRKAVQTLQAGDIAYIRGGTYTGPDNRNLYNKFEGNNGTFDRPIIIRNYPNEVPILDGGFTTPSGLSIDPVFDIQGKSYITLDSLTIRRGRRVNIRLSEDVPATHIIIQNCDLKEFVVYDNSAAIYMDTGTDDITVQNNKIHNMQGEFGFDRNGAGIIIFHGGTLNIRNNEIYSTNNGIYYKHSTDNAKIATFENNFIYNQDKWGIMSAKADTIIKNNIIYNTGNAGIQIFEGSSVCDDLISDNNQIIHNTIVDTQRGVYLDKGTGGCTGAVDTLVKDNLIYNFSNSEIRGLAVWPYYDHPNYTLPDESNTTFDHNLIYSSRFSSSIRVLDSYYSTSSVPLTGADNIQAEPLFRDYENKKFMLKPNSPGKKAASDGNDMGANVCKVGLDPCPSVATIVN